MRRIARISLLASALLAAPPLLALIPTPAMAEAPPHKPEPAGGQDAALPAAAAVTNAPALPRNADDALRALDARARAGELDAQIGLAEYFVSGTKPDPRDVKRALFWYEQAAGRGDADAAWALASLNRYRHELLEKSRADMEEAVRWYRHAADQGHAEAMYDLGLMYTEGSGVPRDTVQAAHWFERAADAGIARALFMLGILYEQGVDGAPDLETAAGWYSQAAATGDATAEVALKRLAEGQGNVRIADLPLERAMAKTATAAARQAPPAAEKQKQAAKPVPVTQAGVKEIQQLLARLGYKPGKADGHLGKRTTAAIRAYQKAQKLSVDGRATQTLLEHLRRRVQA